LVLPFLVRSTIQCPCLPNRITLSAFALMSLPAFLPLVISVIAILRWMAHSNAATVCGHNNHSPYTPDLPRTRRMKLSAPDDSNPSKPVYGCRWRRATSFSRRVPTSILPNPQFSPVCRSTRSTGRAYSLSRRSSSSVYKSIYLLAADDGEEILIQADWDFPGVANTFGWSPCHCGTIAGTVDCPHKTASAMISDAAEYLDDHVGESVADPGYIGN
jgi:hypothetical protein